MAFALSARTCICACLPVCLLVWVRGFEGERGYVGTGMIISAAHKMHLGLQLTAGSAPSTAFLLTSRLSIECGTVFSFGLRYCFLQRWKALWIQVLVLVNLLRRDSSGIRKPAVLDLQLRRSKAKCELFVILCPALRHDDGSMLSQAALWTGSAPKFNSTRIWGRIFLFCEVSINCFSLFQTPDRDVGWGCLRCGGLNRDISNENISRVLRGCQDSTSSTANGTSYHRTGDKDCIVVGAGGTWSGV